MNLDGVNLDRETKQVLMDLPSEIERVEHGDYPLKKVESLFNSLRSTEVYARSAWEHGDHRGAERILMRDLVSAVRLIVALRKEKTEMAETVERSAAHQDRIDAALRDRERREEPKRKDRLLSSEQQEAILNLGDYAIATDPAVSARERGQAKERIAAYAAEHQGQPNEHDRALMAITEGVEQLRRETMRPKAAAKASGPEPGPEPPPGVRLPVLIIATGSLDHTRLFSLRNLRVQIAYQPNTMRPERVQLWSGSVEIVAFEGNEALAVCHALWPGVSDLRNLIQDTGSTEARARLVHLLVTDSGPALDIGLATGTP